MTSRLLASTLIALLTLVMAACDARNPGNFFSLVGDDDEPVYLYMLVEVEERDSDTSNEHANCSVLVLSKMFETNADGKHLYASEGASSDPPLLDLHCDSITTISKPPLQIETIPTKYRDLADLEG